MAAFVGSYNSNGKLEVTSCPLEEVIVALMPGVTENAGGLFRDRRGDEPYCSASVVKARVGKNAACS